MNSRQCLFILGVVSSIAILAACSILVSAEKNKDSASVVIAFSTQSGVSSSWTETIETVDITGAGPGSASFSAFNTSRRTPVAFTIKPGKWSLEAVAKDTEGAPVAHGSALVKVRSGTTKPVTISLESLSDEVEAWRVIYHGNSNTGGEVPIDPAQYTEGQTITISGNTGGLVKEGFAFVGWNTQPDGSGQSYLPGDNFTIETSDVALYAQWNELAEIPAPTASFQFSGPDTFLDEETGSYQLYQNNATNQVTYDGNQGAYFSAAGTSAGVNTTAPHGDHAFLYSNSTFVSGAASFSIELYFRVAADALTEEYFGYLYTERGTDWGVIEISRLGGGEIRITAGTSDVSLVSSPVVLDGNWHHVIITKDTGGTHTLYVDGENYGSIVRSGGGATQTRIGAHRSNMHPWWGWIGQLRVWRGTTLEPSEVQAAYWRFLSEAPDLP
jgi:uncharacterized repeat protein (TIGR02543 family)